MIRETVSAGASYQVLGAVRGFVPDVGPLLTSFEEFRPNAIGLGISSEELRAFTDHFVGAEQEPVVPLTSTELAEVRGLSQFGEVRVPNPSLLRAIEWAQDRGLPVEALDPGDDRYAIMFADTISYTELVRRTVRERRLTRAPPRAASADEYALTWVRIAAGGSRSVRFATERDGVLVQGARLLGRRHPRVSLVVDRERFSRVVGMLREGARTGEGSSRPSAVEDVNSPADGERLAER